MPSSPMKVLFIAGAGRSGSTLLDGILGQIPGFVSVGELRYIWERGFLEDRLCGCGEPFSSCSFWTAVVSDAFGSPPRVDPSRMQALQRLGTRIRQLPRILTGTDATILDAMGVYLDEMAHLYEAIAGQSNAHVIVDSSKLPTYGYFVGRLPRIDLRILHLVRDPRATAYSWLRTKTLPDRAGATMQRQRPFKSAALWSVWNLTAERLWSSDPHRYTRVRYEDLVRDPRGIVEQIVSFVGERAEKLPFASSHTVDLACTHSVAGNPSRFRTGLVDIRADDEWATELQPRMRAIVETVSLPLRGRYGYARRVN